MTIQGKCSAIRSSQTNSFDLTDKQFEKQACNHELEVTIREWNRKESAMVCITSRSRSCVWQGTSSLSYTGNLSPCYQDVCLDTAADRRSTCKYFGATASGNSLDDAEVTDAFENNHYWKYRYEFMEDDHLNFLLLLFHLYRCKSFLSEAKDKWKLLGGKSSVRKDPAKRMQRRAYIKTKVSSKPSQ